MNKSRLYQALFFILLLLCCQCGKDEGRGPSLSSETTKVEEDLGEANLDNVSPYIENGDEVKPGDSIQIYASKLPQKNVTFEWRLIAPEGSRSILNDTKLANPVFIPDKKGTYVAWLVAKSGKNTSKPIPVTIRVKNRVPVAVIEAKLTQGVMGTVFQLDGGKSSDPDQDKLNFGWYIVRPDGSKAELLSTIQSQTSFKADKKGVYKVELFVSDGEAQSEMVAKEIQVLNSAPTFKAIMNRMSATLDDTVDLYLSQPFDLDGDVLTTLWKIKGLDDLKDFSLNLAGDKQHFKATKRGKYEIKAEVTDGTAVVSSPILKLTVINRNPVADLKKDAVEATVGKVIHLDARGSSDPDGDDITSVKWTINDGEKVLIGKEVSYTVATKKSQKIKLEVTDGLGGSASKEDSVLIINQSPRAIILASPVKGSLTDVFHLFSHGGPDLDGDPLTNSWEIRDKADGMLVAQKSGEEIEVQFTKVSIYEVKLTVSDGSTIVRSEPVILSLENRPPKAVADVTPQEAHIRTSIRLQSLTGDDPDGDKLSTTWKIKKPGGETVQLTGVENSFEVIPVGTYEVILSVTDGFSFSEDYKEVHVTNEKPTAVAKATPASMVGREVVSLDGSQSYDTDTADQGKLSYKWTLVSQPVGSSVSLGVDEIKSKLSFLPSYKGTYNVELQVSDGVMKSDPVYVSIAVENRPPEIQSLTATKTVAFIDEGIVLSAVARSDSGMTKFQWKSDSDKVLLSRAEVTSSSPVFKAIEPGHYTVSLIVNDGESDSAPETIALDVVNRKPVIDLMSVSPLRVNQGGTVQLSASASDPDVRHVSLLTYDWKLFDDQGQMVKLTSGKTGEFVIPERKSYQIELRVTDTFDAIAQSKTIQVDNAAPVITGIHMDPLDLYLGDFVTLSADVDDLEKDSLAYVWSVKNSVGQEMLATDLRALDRPRFEISAKGQYDIKLSLTDAQGAKSERSASLTTLNKPLTLSDIYLKTQPYLVGNGIHFSSDALDPDSDVLKYTWEVWKGTTKLNSFSTAEIDFTPPSYGQYSVKLKVSDSMDSVSIGKEFTTQNRDPYHAQIRMLTDVIILNKPLDAKCEAQDLDLDSLTCDWQLVKPGGLVESQSKAMAENAMYVIRDFGDYSLRLIVKDPQGAQTESISYSFKVDNHAPQIMNVSTDPLILNKNIPVTISADAQDLESSIDKLKFHWTLKNSEGTVLGELSGKSATFTPSVKGTINYILSVTDENGLESSKMDSWIVANARPTLGSMTFSPSVVMDNAIAQLLKGESYTVSISASDTDQDPLTYSWAVSGGGALAPSTSTASFNGTEYGTFAITVLVSDGDVSVSKSQDFKLQSRPPVASIILDPTGEIETLGEVKIKGDISDPDGDSVTSSWSIELPDRTKQSLQSVNNQTAYVANVAGIYKVELTVTDISGAETKAHAEFTVSSGKGWGQPAPDFFSGFIGCYHPKQYGETEDDYYIKVLSRKGFFRFSPQMRPGFDVNLAPIQMGLVPGGASQASIPASWPISTDGKVMVPGSWEAGKIHINSNYISVADRYNHRIQIFDKKECLEKVNQPVYQTFYGAMAGGSSNYYAVPNNEVCFCMPKYVLGKSDPLNSEKNVSGSGNGEFNEPIDTVFVEVDGKTYLWVSDTKNKRLQLFEMKESPQFIKEVKLDHEPRSIAAFKDKIFVVNAVIDSAQRVSSGKIEVFDHNGDIKNEIPLNSAGPRLVKGIGNIEATDDGILFVFVWDGAGDGYSSSVRAFDANTFVVLSSVDLTRSPDSQFSGYTEWMNGNDATSFVRGIDFGVFKRGELVIGHGSLPSIIYQREGNRLKNCQFSDASVWLPPISYQNGIRNSGWIFKRFFTEVPSGKGNPIRDDLFYFNIESSSAVGSGGVGAYGNHIYVANPASHFIMVHRRNVYPKSEIIGSGKPLRDVTTVWDQTYHYYICNEPTGL